MPGSSQRRLSHAGKEQQQPATPRNPAGTGKLVVYSLEDCTQCEMLKSFLRGCGVTYKEEDMGSAASLTELRIHGVFVQEAPVLRIGETFLTTDELFAAGKLNEDLLKSLRAGD